MTTIRREITVGAPASSVFAFFVDPALLTRWMGIDADLDARPGGLFRVNINATMVVTGAYRTIDAPRRVVFTWGWDGQDNAVPPGSSEVEVTLREINGATLVAIEHRGLPDDDAVKGHTEGWDHYLERFAAVASGGDPGPDPWVSPSSQCRAVARERRAAPTSGHRCRRRAAARRGAIPRRSRTPRDRRAPSSTPTPAVPGS